MPWASAARFAVTRPVLARSGACPPPVRAAVSRVPTKVPGTAGRAGSGRPPAGTSARSPTTAGGHSPTRTAGPGSSRRAGIRRPRVAGARRANALTSRGSRRTSPVPVPVPARVLVPAVVPVPVRVAPPTSPAGPRTSSVPVPAPPGTFPAAGRRPPAPPRTSPAGPQDFPPLDLELPPERGSGRSRLRRPHKRRAVAGQQTGLDPELQSDLPSWLQERGVALAPARRLVSLSVALFAALLGFALVAGAYTLPGSYGFVIFGGQLFFVLAWVVAMRPPGPWVVAGVGVVAAAGADVAAVLPKEASLAPLGYVTVAGFVFGVLGQLVRGAGRQGVAESL